MKNVIDLFAGAGGFSEGFRKDFNIVAHIEKDRAASKTLLLREIFYYLNEKKDLNLYSSYLKNDIDFETLLLEIPSYIKNKVVNNEINAENLPDIFEKLDTLLKDKEVDGIIGGPPCQAYSTIGRKRNESKKLDDERIYLFNFYADFLKKYQPNFFVFENVQGLVSFKDSQGNLLLPEMLKHFNTVLGEAEYTIDYRVINCGEYGVSQNRNRLFVVGVKSELLKNNVFENLIDYKEIPMNIKNLFSDLPSMKHNSINNSYIENTYLKQKHYYRKFELPLTLNQSRKHNSRDLEIYKLAVKLRERGETLKYNELPERLITHKNTNAFLDRFKALSYDGLSHTVVAHISKDGHYYIHPDKEQNRSITVREAARIQSFSDDFYFEDSRTSAFVQIGNAVPPIFANKLSSAIVKSIY